jgi:hypothetical protein
MTDPSQKGIGDTVGELTLCTVASRGMEVHCKIMARRHSVPGLILSSYCIKRVYHNNVLIKIEISLP